MWTGSQLKENAKAVLKQSYWKAFIASLLLSAVTSGSSGSSTASGVRGISNSIITGNLSVSIVITALSALAMTLLLGTAFSVFISAPLEVGAQRYFLESTQFRFNLSELGYAFGSGHYLKIVAAIFVKNMYQFFWSMLFVIPGIIKGYSYSLVPYILSENPTLSPNEAITLSRRMTNGHKWDIFMLDVSFIGWFILGAICLGVGTLFVMPYYNSTRAQLYLALRSIALDRGIVSLYELESR